MGSPARPYRLVLDNCIRALAELPENSVDALVTDPPFAFAGGLSNGQTSVADDQFFRYWWREICRELERVLKPDGEGFVWCDWRTAPVMADGFNVDQQRTWRMAQMIYHYREMPGMGQPFRSSVDMIAYVRGPKSTAPRIANTTENWISKYWYYGKHEHHPAEKSVEIATQLVEWCSDPGDVVVDPFMGSGTVGVACAATGRQFIGMEKERDHFKTAEGRVGQAYKGVALAVEARALPPLQPSLFTATAMNQPTLVHARGAAGER